MPRLGNGLNFMKIKKHFSIDIPWDPLINLDNPEPNDAQGNEECVRMRNGVMNDARCGNTQGGKKVKLIFFLKKI